MPYKFNPFSGNFDEVKDISGKIDKVTSTDNAVTRYDGTTGDVQNSGVTIDDSNNVIIPGTLTVNGTTTTVNTATLDVTDANITVNNTGNQATADANDAGITVEMSDATDAIIGYDSTLASKFAIGEVGSTSEILSASTTQTITGLKTISRSGASSGFEIDHNGSGNALEITQAGAGDAIDIGAGNLTISNAGNLNTTGTVTLPSLTASRVLTTNGSSEVSISTVTTTELGYVSGVTSAIQTQLDAKAVIADIFSMNTTSGTNTLTANETYVVNTSGGVATLTLPAATTDTFVRIKDNGNAETNNITIQTPGAETIDGAATHVINSNYGSVIIVSDGTNYYVL